jgi:hypothetical protein
VFLTVQLRPQSQHLLTGLNGRLEVAAQLVQLGRAG